MIKSQLTLNVAGQFFHLPHRVVEKAVDVVLDEIVTAMARKDRVELRGFGAFSVEQVALAEIQKAALRSRCPERACLSSGRAKKSADGSTRRRIAANLVGDTVLILRCKDQTTEAAFSTQYNYLGYSSVDVELRINDQTSTKEVWKASMNGRAAFAPDAVAFIESLPDNGNLSIKTTRSTDGKVKEGRFKLDAVSEVRNKIAKACDWANGSVDEPVGSIDHQEKR